MSTLVVERGRPVENTVTRKRVGFVVMYPDKPGYLAMPMYLVLTDGRLVPCGFSLSTAQTFADRELAEQAVLAFPDAGCAAHEPGQVVELFEETRLVLGDVHRPHPFVGRLGFVFESKVAPGLPTNHV